MVRRYRRRNCGCSSMAEFQPSKLAMRVRSPSPAPGKKPWSAAYSDDCPGLSSSLGRGQRPLEAGRCRVVASSVGEGADSVTRRTRAVVRSVAKRTRARGQCFDERSDRRRGTDRDRRGVGVPLTDDGTDRSYVASPIGISGHDRLVIDVGSPAPVRRRGPRARIGSRGGRATSRITSTRSRLGRARHTPGAAVAVAFGGIAFRRSRRRAEEWL